MPPSIDIDDETFELLKERAEPFVDTPASVLRRLLGLDSRVPQKDDGKAEPRTRNSTSLARSHGRRRRGRRAARGTLLPEAEYELPILRYLNEHDGRAPSREVVEGVGKELADKLTSADREELKSGDIRWKNRVAFVRLRLVEKGDLDGKAPRGTWQITDSGLQRVTNSVSE
jgi:hypothetical protein